VKIIEGYELKQFKGWEWGTLEIWTRQTTKKPRKINVSNEYFFNGMWWRLLNMKHGVQTNMQNLENPSNNFNKLNIIIWIA